jgi:hypothetical protein
MENVLVIFVYFLFIIMVAKIECKTIVAKFLLKVHQFC